MGMLVVGGFMVENTEDWRKAIFALMLFSVVVGLPEGLMGFAARFLAKLFRIAPPALAGAGARSTACCRSGRRTAARLLELRDLKRYFGGVKAVDGVSMTVRSGADPRPDRPQRLGQEHRGERHLRALHPHRGRDPAARATPCPQGSLFQVARAGVARTFQNLQLFGELTALDNVMVALKGVYRSPLPLVLLGLARRRGTARPGRGAGPAGAGRAQGPGPQPWPRT